MNPLERKRQEYHAKIRGLGSRIRVMGLDREDSTSEESDAQAAAIFSAHTESEVRDGLSFATYLKEYADAGCSACSGVGATRVGEGDTATFTPCECARKNERRRREEAPAVRVRTTRGTDLDRRVEQVEATLAEAERRRDEAVAPAQREVDLAGEWMEVLEKTRMDLEGDLGTKKTEGIRARVAVEDAQAALRRAEARLREATSLAERVEATLAAFEENRAPVVEEFRALVEKRDRVARHHEPKIEKHRRRLERLRYLRGDAPARGAEDVSGEFSDNDVPDTK